MTSLVLLPSPRVNMLDTGGSAVVGGGGVDPLNLPALCGPHRGIRRPSGGTAESESDSPPSKKSKKSRRRRKRPRHRSGMQGLRNKPVAPFNTTQFLMEEHDQLQDTDIVNVRPRRHRDSSFSFDSDDANNYYSSPEDEEEFMTREFWTAYEDVHAERLDTMTKAQLVQEYLALEEKVDLLERQLRAVRARHRNRNQFQDDDDETTRPGEVRVDPETAQKITIFQTEITNLESENRRLREENQELRRSTSSRSSSSSSSSSDESSSDSSSSSSDSSSDSEVEDERNQREEKEPKLTRGSPIVTCLAEEDVGQVLEEEECQPDSGVSCDSGEVPHPRLSPVRSEGEAGVEEEVTSTT